FDRQIERECRSGARRAAQMDFPTEQARQLPADGETETGTAIFAASRGVGLLEGLENELLLFEWDADAGIRDLERDDRRRLAEHRMLRAPTARRHGHVEANAALRRELEGIRKEVLEHLLQALGVGCDAAPEVRIDMNLER